jgi:hypothetical protein
MKRLYNFLPLFLVFTLLTIPFVSLATCSDLDEEIEKALEEVEESIKNIKIPEIKVPDIPEIKADIDSIQAKVKVIEDIFDDDFQYRVEKKILPRLKFPGEGIVSFLALDETTEKKIKDLQLKHKEEMIDYRSKIEKLELEIERILMEERLDTGKLLSKYKELAELREEADVKKIEHKINIYNLIPEDKKKDAKDFFFNGHPNLKFYFKDLGDFKGFREGMQNFKENMEEFKETMKENAKKIAERYKKYHTI